jgi:hypothetical protein
VVLISLTSEEDHGADAGHMLTVPI